MLIVGAEGKARFRAVLLCTLIALIVLSSPAGASAADDLYRKYCEDAVSTCLDSECNPLVSGCGAPCYDGVRTYCYGECAMYSSAPAKCWDQNIGGLTSCYISCIVPFNGGASATCMKEKCQHPFEMKMDACIKASKESSSNSSSSSSSSGTTDAGSSKEVSPSAASLAASFSASPLQGTAPLTVAFTDTSTGEPVSRIWTFHDGQTATAQTVRYTYQIPGSFREILTVKAADGRTSSASMVITIQPSQDLEEPVMPPRAAIAASTNYGSVPLRVNFTDQSTGSISERVWDFGDGFKSEIKNPSHKFEKPGKYTVKLTVSGNGGTDSDTLVVEVIEQTEGVPIPIEPPVAVISASTLNGPAPLIVHFRDDSIGEVSSREWRIGEYRTEQREFSYQFEKPDNYRIYLTVYGDGGSDLDSRIVYVTEPVTNTPEQPGTMTKVADSILAAGVAILGTLMAIGAGMARTEIADSLKTEYDGVTKRIRNLEEYRNTMEKTLFVIDPDAAATYNLPEGTCHVHRTAINDEASEWMAIHRDGPASEREEVLKACDEKLTRLRDRQKLIQEKLETMDIKAVATRKIPEILDDIHRMDGDREKLAWDNIDKGREVWRAEEIDKLTERIDEQTCEVRRWRRNLTGKDNVEMRLKEMKSEIEWLKNKRENINELSTIRREFEFPHRDLSYQVNQEYTTAKLQHIDEKIVNLEAEISRMEKRMDKKK